MLDCGGLQKVGLTLIDIIDSFISHLCLLSAAVVLHLHLHLHVGSTIGWLDVDVLLLVKLIHHIVINDLLLLLVLVVLIQSRVKVDNLLNVSYILLLHSLLAT